MFMNTAYKRPVQNEDRIAFLDSIYREEQEKIALNQLRVLYRDDEFLFAELSEYMMYNGASESEIGTLYEDLELD